MRKSSGEVPEMSDVPSTPNRKRRANNIDQSTPSLVTPSKFEKDVERTELKSRRPLSLGDRDDVEVSSPRRGSFGRAFVNEITAQTNTRQVYALVNKMTGSIGGNGHGGAIYGELTVGSMQKMVDLMKEHTNLGPDSRFIDVGSGLGKPNLHVAQDPKVEFSYGIEMEHVRWVLGMSNLKVVLEDACNQQKSKKKLTEDEIIGHRCTFKHGDITEANYFDPFTHVYMFDIGFPPKLFKVLGEMFNRSQSEYLICYHGPKLMIEKYGFNVELIIQTPTSMHGSSEGHMGYIYRRAGKKSKIPGSLPRVNGIPCDPLFKPAWEETRQDVKTLYKSVQQQVTDSLNSERPKRKRKVVTMDPYISATKSLK